MANTTLRCLSYGESTKKSKERRGPTLGVHFMESQQKGEKKGRNQL